jgi:SAM-dependent methyltransferase
VSVFGGYARYYDLLYRDKDYAGEAAYVAARIREHVAAAREALELGAGSGRHAVELARLGFDVTGVDRSEAMVAEATRRGLRVQHGDARSVRLGRRFDAVLALFHVMSYQVSDADVDGFLRTAAEHLAPGSPFVFDFWYGPAVLAQRPESRVKRVQDGNLRIERLAEPRLREAEQCVEVAYTLKVENGETLREQHTMRYFFLPELERALARCRLRLVSAAEMQTGAPLGEATWSACATAVRT